MGHTQLLIRFGRALLEGIAVVWLFLEPFCGLMPSDAARPGYFCFLIPGLLAGVIWFFIDGVWVAGFLKRSIEITSNAVDTPITVLFGDVFKQTGCKAISVNDFFDSAVDNRHVAEHSLHGGMLTRYWAGNVCEWDCQVSQGLAATCPVETIDTRTAPGKKSRYPIGTTVCVSRNGDEFLCVALTKTDVQTMEVSATPDDLQHAVHGLLCKARTVCAGRPLNIPLIGSGLARTGVKPNVIVELILLAIFEESKVRKITNEIRIVLPENMQKRIDLAGIERNWW